MHFYLPRRHRRYLLFPPGLLALAGLLWLGCVALGPWQEALKLKSVMQLTMPSLYPHDEDGTFNKTGIDNSPDKYWFSSQKLANMQQ